MNDETHSPTPIDTATDRTEPDRPLTAVQELIGVYNADRTFRGEISYWLNARFGRGHCELCDITHGVLREKSEWSDCRSSIDIPFTTLHRDELPRSVAALAADAIPCVIARTTDGLTLLLSTAQLARCAGSPSLLLDALNEAATECGLVIGSKPSSSMALTRDLGHGLASTDAPSAAEWMSDDAGFPMESSIHRPQPGAHMPSRDGCGDAASDEAGERLDGLVWQPGY